MAGYHTQEEGRKKLLAKCPTLNEQAGIYIFSRPYYPDDQVGQPHYYVGQAIHLLSEIIAKCMGYQPIGLSIRKRGIDAYKIEWFPVHAFGGAVKAELDDAEQMVIKKYRGLGYYLYNKNTGGTKGKEKIGEDNPNSGMHLKERWKQRYENAYELLKLIYKQNKKTIKELDETLDRMEGKEVCQTLNDKI